MFIKKTVQQVVSGFQKTIDDLQSIVDREKLNQQVIEEKIKGLTEGKANSEAEQEQAARIKQKIEDLLK